MIGIKDIVYPIKRDYLSGMSFVAIGKKYKIDPRTAKRHAINNLPLEHLENRPFSSILDPYKEIIDQWLLNGRVFATTVHDRLTELGCTCGYTIVDSMQALYKEYLLFQAEEDVARITLFVHHTLRTLYHVIGEENYSSFIGAFSKVKRFSSKCNLEIINQVIADYNEKEYQQDDPETLTSVLISLFGQS